MSDYAAVERSLADGADPRMLCQTCPWDRYCISPPSMSKADVDAQLEQAKVQDEQQQREAQARGEKGGLPMGSLLTAITMGRRHRMADVCPVFALRLRSSAGREIAQQTKDTMVSWDDQR